MLIFQDCKYYLILFGCKTFHRKLRYINIATNAAIRDKARGNFLWNEQYTAYSANYFFPFQGEFAEDYKREIYGAGRLKRIANAIGVIEDTEIFIDDTAGYPFPSFEQKPGE